MVSDEKQKISMLHVKCVCEKNDMMEKMRTFPSLILVGFPPLEKDTTIYQRYC
jgi:hypothetical protein